MSSVVRLGLALIVSTVGLSVGAEAQQHHRAIIMSTPSAPPIITQPSTPAVNPGGAAQAGAPNTSTPGIIGTGARPSGLAGDNPTAPGFPGRVGRD